VPTDEEIDIPKGNADERELLLAWLRFLRGAVVRSVEGLSDDEARRRVPDGQLVPLLGIVRHLTNVEWRWIDGGFIGAEVSRTDAELLEVDDLTVAGALDAYGKRAADTEAVVRSLELDTPHSYGHDIDLRYVLLHLLNETARHAGHADSVRQLIDGTTGE
jgi:Protein of unknown function (DUF664)